MFNLEKLKTASQKNWEYILSLKKEIILASIVLMISAIVGFISSNLNTDKTIGIFESLKVLAKTIVELNNFELFIIIFLNNSIKIIISSLSGVLFGIIPLFFLITNGFVVGTVAQVVGSTDSFTSFFIGILPHGMLEIPVLILGSAVGLRLGNLLVKKLGKREVSLKIEFFKAMKFCLLILTPILFFTAFVEVFVTQFLIQ